MEDNPYSVMINSIRQDTSRQLPTIFRLGKVSGTAPLKIEVAGTTQTASSLLKNNVLSFFETGERVLLLPIEDEQRYIIICKVVSA